MGKIKVLIMDVDGTLTDGKIYMGENGEVLKVFNIKDGYGIHNVLPEKNIEPIIITGRESIITYNRCAELGIKEVYQNVKDKKSLLEQIKYDKRLDYTEIAYIGDDMVDYECMKLIHHYGGITGCPFDAVDEIKEVSTFVSVKNGGDGAVREFIEWFV